MTPEQIKALSDERLLDEIIEWADNVAENQETLLIVDNYAEKAKKYRLRLENAERTIALLRAEALRRMNEGREAGRV